MSAATVNEVYDTEGNLVSRIEIAADHTITVLVEDGESVEGGP